MRGKPRGIEPEVNKFMAKLKQVKKETSVKLKKHCMGENYKLLSTFLCVAGCSFKEGLGKSFILIL